MKDLILKNITDIQSSFIQDEEKSLRPISPIVVVECAVLLDTNWDSDDLFDAIWVVNASDESRLFRLVEYRKMKESDALERMNAQRCNRGIGNLEDEVRDGSVTAVIDNSEEDEDALWLAMKASLINHECWKVDRYPVLNDQVDSPIFNTVMTQEE